MDDPQKKSPGKPGNGSANGHAHHPLGESLLRVPDATIKSVPLSQSFAWFVELCGQFAQGGVYMIDGAPGSCKSTLARQIGLDLADQGHGCLFVLTEEPSCRLKHAVSRMTHGWTRQRRESAMSKLFAEVDVQDLQYLPRFLARKVLGPNAPFNGVKMIVLDSVNGSGLRACDLHRWQALYDFSNLARGANISVLLISHVNKRNEMAGPRATEHNVDAALRLRKSGVIRHLGLSKNRFGPECHRLLPLDLDPKTVMLKPSKHVSAAAAVARSFMPGLGLVELQASVGLPPWGSRPRMMAPNLPRKEVELLLAGLSAIPNLQFDDLSSTISCRLPGDGRYVNVFSMALCIALVGSLLQRPIPPHLVMVGEVDLMRSIRELNELFVTELAQSLVDGALALPLRLMLPVSAAARLPKMKGLEVLPVRTLDEAIAMTFGNEVTR